MHLKELFNQLILDKLMIKLKSSKMWDKKKDTLIKKV